MKQPATMNECNIEIQTDKDNVIKEEKKVQLIKGIEHVIESEELGNVVYSLTVTEDKRIASGDKDGNISIYHLMI